MKTNTLLLVSIVSIAALACVAVAAGIALPADARLPIHWNAAGEVDGLAGKWFALLLPVGFAGLLTATFVATTRIEPAREAMARSAGLIRAVWLGMLGLAWVIELMVLSVAFHWRIAAVRFLLVGMGLLFVAMGDQLGKSRPMRFVGIRTPWTLADPDVWIATHRLGGKLFVVAGAIWIIAGFAGFYGPHATKLLLAVLLGFALFPAAWSYVLWRRAGRPNRG